MSRKDLSSKLTAKHISQTRFPPMLQAVPPQFTKKHAVLAVPNCFFVVRMASAGERDSKDDAADGESPAMILA